MMRFPNRRRAVRTEIEISGRGMRANGAEFTCQTLNISGIGASVAAPVTASPGERIVIYLNEIGRVAGQVVSPTRDGFAMEFHHSAIKSAEVDGKVLRLARHRSVPSR